MIELGIIDSAWSLSPRDPDVEPWDKISEDERDFLLPMIEVYAAMVDRLDQNIGRLLDDLKANDELENTLIVFFSDNGACPYNHNRAPGVAPGPAESYFAYDARWANMCNSPLRLYKQYAHEGGTLTPMIAHWPARIRHPGTVSKYTGHIVDLMPTVVELADATYPTKVGEQEILPMEGISLTAALDGLQEREGAPIFWEYVGNHAIRDGKWKLVAERSKDWELYDISVDRSETSNLAQSHPGRVAKMSAAYDAWASRAGAKSHKKSHAMSPSSQSRLFDLSHPEAKVK